ncbi:MAG TPA: bifunctional riboflavin kinase/FAD synthetase [Puia sp.]|nr:bifunctional riboflavin kinase/FAD synthetase [Puia sp.]
MRIYYHIDELPLIRKAVITIGSFDGVHTGHAQILQQLRAEAARIGGETVIVTFYPHPRKVVRGGSGEVRLLSSLEEKIQLLSWQQVDHLVVVPFTEAFSQLTAEEYIREFLLKRFRPHTIIIGYDHRYGRGRQGDYHLLEQFSLSEGFVLQEIPVHLLDAISVSSTRIREAIGRADIDSANQLLGYPYFFSGQVVEGRRLGRTIGYPTANLVVDSEKLVPADGVYAVEVARVASDSISLTAPTMVEAPAVAPWETQRFGGMMNIGMRPTVDGRERTIEVNIFDFDEDLYRRELRVMVRKWLRGEQRFDGLDALKAQLGRDRDNALAALGRSFRQTS